jgi:quinol monooxygenase YgiN
MPDAITRHYVMQAKPNGGNALLKVLERIAVQVEAIEECTGVEVLRDFDDHDRFLLIERWTSVDAHQQAGSKLQENLLPDLIAALSGQPQSGYYETLTAR